MKLSKVEIGAMTRQIVKQIQLEYGRRAKAFEEEHQDMETLRLLGPIFMKLHELVTMAKQFKNSYPKEYSLATTNYDTLSRILELNSESLDSCIQTLKTRFIKQLPDYPKLKTIDTQEIEDEIILANLPMNDREEVIAKFVEILCDRFIA